VLALGSGAARIEVADGSAVMPAPREYGLISAVGRGLRLLNALGTWGCEPLTATDQLTKRVWFEPSPQPDERAFTDEFTPDLSDWGLDDPPPAAGPQAGTVGAGSPQDTAEQPPRLVPAAGLADGSTTSKDSSAGTRAVLGRYDTRPVGELVTVRMLRFPLRLFAAAREHHDELIREFSLLALAAPESASRPLPQQLVGLIETLGGRYRAAAERADAVRDTALARGDLSIDLTYQVPSSARESMIALGRLMDEADRFCRDERLLTLAEEPTQQQFRRWFTTQFVDQINGHPAVAWTGPLTLRTPARIQRR
jgi:hypothetical protein